MIAYGRQDVTDDDVAAVVEVLRSDFLTQGPVIPRFEKAISEATGARHCVAVSNATAGLHIAYDALGVGPGDVVWTAPNTFVATANAARYCGATVDFVDIDPETFNLSVEALAEKLASTRKAGGLLPKLVAPVHFGGEPCDMEAIAALAREYGFRVVEDASHAIGSRYRGSRVGDSTYSDATVFSFHPVKIVTTGEGGAISTNDDELHTKLAMLRSHGITRDAALMQGESHGGWYYQQLSLGYNYRMTDIQAALGASQMERLEAYIDRRQALAKVYDDAFANSGIGTQRRAEDARSALHLYVILWPETAVRDRRAAFDGLRAKGVGVNMHYIPVHLQPYYAKLGFRPGYCPHAERYYSRAITIPLHPRMTEDDQGQVIDSVLDLLAA
jgi:UDP-4-amino-4,6-dideoxy-N-acetyl-beta-L-altrosamine transaminase